MILSGQQCKELCQALINAFPRYSDLEMMVAFQLNRNLEEIAGTHDLKNVVFELIKWASAHGRLEELIRGAYKEHPGNPRLKAFYQRFFSFSPPSSFDTDTVKQSTDTKQSTEQPLQESNSDPSTLWAFRYLVSLIVKFLDRDQQEEWIGDLKEVIWKMQKSQKFPSWRINLEIMYRVSPLAKSAICLRIAAWWSGIRKTD